MVEADGKTTAFVDANSDGSFNAYDLFDLLNAHEKEELELEVSVPMTPLLHVQEYGCFYLVYSFDTLSPRI